MLWSASLPIPSTNCQMCEWRSLQMTPDPSSLAGPSLWGLPGGVPKYHGAKTNHPHCAVSKFLTHQICECNKMVNLYHWVGVLWYLGIITGIGMEIRKSPITLLWLHHQEMAGLGSGAGLPVLFLWHCMGDWQWGSESPKPARTRESTTR